MAIIRSEINIADFIDHALLSPSATAQDLEKCCRQADQFQFPTVCVYPSAVKQAVELLHSSKTQVCTVIGFPSGSTTSRVNCYEAQVAADHGATELDVVLNLGWLKAGRSEEIYREIAQIVEETGQTVKAILETTVLTSTEKRLASEICLDAGVSFLKTSTGWFGGATLEDVQLLHQIGQGRVGIKASGGIRNLEQALDLIEAGATRLGTSKGIELVRQQQNQVSEEYDSTY
ncbi:MAG: deoxyribose-phosphate aldolase [Microcystaceae cyanobacterium]